MAILFGVLLVAIPLAGLILLGRVSSVVRDISIERVLRWRKRRKRRADAAVDSSARFLESLVDGAFKIARNVLMLLVTGVYLLLALSVFPETRDWADSLVNQDRIESAGETIIDYLPRAVRILVIAVATAWLLRLMRFIFGQIESEGLRLRRFRQEWARPTYKLLRFPVIAAAVALVVPALPGANTDAFRGLIIFVGILSGLGSTIATSNLVAGVVLTYTGAFSAGDRVLVQGVTGRVADISLFATHLETRRNEFISIPNVEVLGGAVVNYSRLSEEKGLLVSTTVGLGYDVDWRQAYQLLAGSAVGVDGVKPDPEPFVEQTNLDDFAVAYELSVHVEDDADPTLVRSHLHEQIQDAFNDAQIAILSPHYEVNQI